MSSILDFIGSIFGYVLWFFFDLFDNYSLAIVCFSLIVKLLFFPLDIKAKITAAKSAKAFSKQAAIRKMYKDNPRKQAEEINKLAEKEGMGGGLGNLAQVIFQFISIFGIFRAIVKPLTNMFHISGEKVSAAISKLPSLESENLNLIKGYDQLSVVKFAPDRWHIFDMFNNAEISDILDFNKGFNFLGIDFSFTPKGFGFFNVVWLFPLCCFLTSIVSVYINQKVSKMNDMPGCVKFMPYAMMIPYLFFAVNTPIAVGFYYIVTNILTIIETFIIAKFFSPAKLIAKSEAARIARLFEEEKGVCKK